MKRGLQYLSIRDVISSVPAGMMGLVHIWGRNDMPTSQKLGIHWQVRDPNNVIVEDYDDWEWGGTGIGAEHEFIGGRFPLDTPGIWRIAINLRIAINNDVNNPIIVDTYDGDLCMVTEAYMGTISRKELEYDETRGAIPIY